MTTETYFLSPASYRVQKTLQSTLCFKGVGLHSGAISKMWLHPAPANTGIVFRRKGALKDAPIPAHFSHVVGTALATTLGVGPGSDEKVSTVEHIMAAVFAMGVSNIIIELDGSEVPILDGSAAPFVEAILDSGLEIQPFSMPILKITKPIKIVEGGAICELLPRENLRLTTTVDFDHAQIGTQTYALELTPRTFQKEIAQARTFGFLKNFEILKQQKLARGASLENVLAFSEEAILNPEGSRFVDECVRHKLLDALGDLALCGSWIQGEMVSFRGGHSIHLSLLKSLSNYPLHWKLIPAEPLADTYPNVVSIGLRA